MKAWVGVLGCAMMLVACRPSAPEGGGLAPAGEGPTVSSPKPETKAPAPVRPTPDPKVAPDSAGKVGEGIPEPDRPSGVVEAKSYAEGMERAKTDGRDLVILFHGSDWNLQGRDFVAQVWSDPRFQRELGDGFVLLTLDHKERTSEAETAERKKREKGLKYKVPSYPLLLVIDAAGYRVQSLSGDSFPTTRARRSS